MEKIKKLTESFCWCDPEERRSAEVFPEGFSLPGTAFLFSAELP